MPRIGMPRIVSAKSFTLAIMLFSRQFGAMCTNGRNQFRGGNFMAHLAMNPRFSLVDFDEENGAKAWTSSAAV